MFFVYTRIVVSIIIRQPVFHNCFHKVFHRCVHTAWIDMLPCHVSRISCRMTPLPSLLVEFMNDNCIWVSICWVRCLKCQSKHTKQIRKQKHHNFVHRFFTQRTPVAKTCYLTFGIPGETCCWPGPAARTLQAGITTRAFTHHSGSTGRSTQAAHLSSVASTAQQRWNDSPMSFAFKLCGEHSEGQFLRS